MIRELLVGGAAAATLALGLSGPAAAEGDTLRIGHYSMPANFGMPYGSFGADGALPLMAVYEAMTFMDAKGNMKPGLALSWENKDEHTWVFKLRPGVKFHNGKAFNAETVVANVDAINNDETIKTQSATRQLTGIPSARAIDDLTVEITTGKPDPILERRLAIMRPHEPSAWADMGPEGYGRHPVGTGSYRVSEWDAERIIGTACEDCWRPPKIKNLDIRGLPETAARIQALNSGQIDLAWALDPDARLAIEAAGNKVVLSQTNNTINLIFRHMLEDSPVHDARVRQALNYAYDKRTFIDTVLGGITVPAGQPSTPAMAGHFEDIGVYEYDPEKAKQLLTEAGYPDGFDMMAEIVVSSGEFRDTFQAVANDLKRVGVNLELVVISIPDLIKKILKQAQWEGDAFSMMYEGYPTADLSRPMNTHSCIFFNKHTCFEEIQPDITAMNAEFDKEKRLERQRKIAQYYHDNASALYSHVRVQVDGLAKNLDNYVLINRTVNFAELEFGG